MPLPQGFGAPIPSPSTPVVASTAPALPLPPSVPSPTQPVVGVERGRMERERWDRMDVLYQNIRGSARQFEYPAASVAALESVLVRMYFESPLPAPHPQQPQSAYATANLPLAQAQQSEDVAMDHGDQSDGSESDGDEDEDEE